MTTLLLAGATGLVGRALLRLALDDPRITTVIAPTRRPLERRPKLENPVVDYEHLPGSASWWAVDAVACTLGTTIKAAGFPAAFRRVDHDYVLAIARHARAAGARSFALASATGANARSRIFYNRVKGETEESLRACGYPSLTLVRPSLIGGPREERRPAEALGLAVLGSLGPLLPRGWRVVPHETLARALLDAAIEARPGMRVIGSAALA